MIIIIDYRMIVEVNMYVVDWIYYIVIVEVNK